MDERDRLISVVNKSYKAKDSLKKKSHRLAGITAMIESNRDTALYEVQLQRESLMKKIDYALQDRQVSINKFFDDYCDQIVMAKTEYERQISNFNVCCKQAEVLLSFENEEKCYSTDSTSLSDKLQNLCENVTNVPDIINIEKPLTMVYVPTVKKFNQSGLGYIKEAVLDVQKCVVKLDMCSDKPRLYVDLGVQCHEWRDYLDVKLSGRNHICIVNLESNDDDKTVNVVFEPDVCDYTTRVTVYGSNVSNSPFYFVISSESHNVRQTLPIFLDIGAGDSNRSLSRNSDTKSVKSHSLKSGSDESSPGLNNSCDVNCISPSLSSCQPKSPVLNSSLNSQSVTILPEIMHSSPLNAKCDIRKSLSMPDHVTSSPIPKSNHDSMKSLPVMFTGAEGTRNVIHGQLDAGDINDVSVVSTAFVTCVQSSNIAKEFQMPVSIPKTTIDDNRGRKCSVISTDTLNTSDSGICSPENDHVNPLDEHSLSIQKDTPDNMRQLDSVHEKSKSCDNIGYGTCKDDHKVSVTLKLAQTFTDYDRRVSNIPDDITARTLTRNTETDPDNENAQRTHYRYNRHKVSPRFRARYGPQDLSDNTITAQTSPPILTKSCSTETIQNNENAQHFHHSHNVSPQFLSYYGSQDLSDNTITAQTSPQILTRRRETIQNNENAQRFHHSHNARPQFLSYYGSQDFGDNAITVQTSPKVCYQPNAVNCTIGGTTETNNRPFMFDQDYCNTEQTRDIDSIRSSKLIDNSIADRDYLKSPELQQTYQQTLSNEYFNTKQSSGTHGSCSDISSMYKTVNPDTTIVAAQNKRSPDTKSKQKRLMFDCNRMLSQLCPEMCESRNADESNIPDASPSTECAVSRYIDNSRKMRIPSFNKLYDQMSDMEEIVKMQLSPKIEKSPCVNTRTQNIPIKIFENAAILLKTSTINHQNVQLLEDNLIATQLAPKIENPSAFAKCTYEPVSPRICPTYHQFTPSFDNNLITNQLKPKIQETTNMNPVRFSESHHPDAGMVHFPETHYQGAAMLHRPIVQHEAQISSSPVQHNSWPMFTYGIHPQISPRIVDSRRMSIPLSSTVNNINSQHQWNMSLQHPQDLSRFSYTNSLHAQLSPHVQQPQMIPTFYRQISPVVQPIRMSRQLSPVTRQLSPVIQPARMSRQLSPVIKPASMSRQLSPVIQSVRMSRQLSPVIKPASMSRQMSPILDDTAIVSILSHIPQNR